MVDHFISQVKFVAVHHFAHAFASILTNPLPQSPDNTTDNADHKISVMPSVSGRDP